MSLKKTFALLALAAFITTLAVAGPNASQAAGTYYVATNGSDSNPGTQAAPWATIQKGANTAAAGDTVSVQPGTYNERVTVSRPGIIFEAVGTVQMKGFTISANNTTVRGFYITGTANDNITGYGIYITTSNNLIENNYLYYNVRGGVIIQSTYGNASATQNNTVRNNRLERNAMMGVYVSGQNNTVEGNDISKTIQYHPDWTSPPGYVDADGIRFFGAGHILRGNYIHDISYTQPENTDPHIDCFQTWADGSHEVAQNVIIEGNFCKEMETLNSGANGQGFMLEGNSSGIVIRNNIIMAYMGINVNPSPGIQIYNNTIVSGLTMPNNPRGIRLANSPNAIIKNNIVIDAGKPGHNPYIDKDTPSTTGLDAGYNLIYYTDGTTPYGTAYPNDLWAVNPQFVNFAGADLHLQASSPAINAGVTLATVTKDYDGQTRPNGTAWDIGADEFYAPATPTPVPCIPGG